MLNIGDKTISQIKKGKTERLIGGATIPKMQSTRNDAMDSTPISGIRPFTNTSQETSFTYVRSISRDRTLSQRPIQKNNGSSETESKKK